MAPLVLFLLLALLFMGSPPPPPPRRPWHRWHLAAPLALCLLLMGCQPPEAEIPGQVQEIEVPACLCIRPAVIGLEPHQVPRGSAPRMVTLQVMGIGGWVDAWIAKHGDFTFAGHRGTVVVTAWSHRSTDNALLWAEVSPDAEAAFDLKVRGVAVLRDALLVSP